jgi:hypothetical protein
MSIQVFNFPIRSLHHNNPTKISVIINDFCFSLPKCILRSFSYLLALNLRTRFIFALSNSIFFWIYGLKEPTFCFRFRSTKLYLPVIQVVNSLYTIVCISHNRFL